MQISENTLTDYVAALVKRTAEATVEATIERLKGELTTHQNNPDDLLTPKEASDLLRCSITTLWRYEKAGKVKSLSMGGKRYYKRSELMESLSGN